MFESCRCIQRSIGSDLDIVSDRYLIPLNRDAASLPEGTARIDYDSVCDRDAGGAFLANGVRVGACVVVSSKVAKRIDLYGIACEQRARFERFDPQELPENRPISQALAKGLALKQGLEGRNFARDFPLWSISRIEFTSVLTASLWASSDKNSISTRSSVDLRFHIARRTV